MERTHAWLLHFIFAKVQYLVWNVPLQDSTVQCNLSWTASLLRIITSTSSYRYHISISQFYSFREEKKREEDKEGRKLGWRGTWRLAKWTQNRHRKVTGSWMKNEDSILDFFDQIQIFEDKIFCWMFGVLPILKDFESKFSMSLLDVRVRVASWLSSCTITTKLRYHSIHDTGGLSQ